MGTLSWEVVVSLIVMLISMGAAYGDLRARLTRIEKAVFNGHFVTSGEIGLAKEGADREHQHLDDRISRLEDHSLRERE